MSLQGGPAVMLDVAIRKQLGDFRLDVSFCAGADGATGLFGASGSGKSVTLRCIAGIETPDEGRITLNGRTLYDSEKKICLPPQKRRVGYLFQHYALFPHMTAAQNIASAVRERGQRAETVRALVRALHLEGSEHKYPRQLSGGQQQRTALARMLASDPEVLLLDEPFSALDGYLKWQVEQTFADRLTQFTGPVIYVTHDREEMRSICERACVLAEGQSQPMQRVEALFRAPLTKSACLLTGCRNLSRACAAGTSLKALDWDITLDCTAPLPKGLAYVGIHSYHLKLADTPGKNRIKCRLLRATEEPPWTILLLKRGEAHLQLALPEAPGRQSRYPEEIWVELPPNALLPLLAP